MYVNTLIECSVHALTNVQHIIIIYTAVISLYGIIVIAGE